MLQADTHTHILCVHFDIIHTCNNQVLVFYSTHGTTRILRQMQAPTLFEKQNWETSCIHSWSLQHTDTRRTTKSRHEPAQMGRESAKTRSRHVRTSQDLLSMLKTCSYKSRPACSGPDSLPGVAPLCLQVLMQSARCMFAPI